MCSLAAAVQGMDETVNNGAQAFYLKRFNITTARFSKKEVDNLTGLVVGAPYLACAILGCWLTEPLNSVFARRGTIFISCFIAAVASVVSFPIGPVMSMIMVSSIPRKERVLNSSHHFVICLGEAHCFGYLPRSNMLSQRH
jgi:MFS family permease